MLFQETNTIFLATSAWFDILRKILFWRDISDDLVELQILFSNEEYYVECVNMGEKGLILQF